MFDIFPSQYFFAYIALQKYLMALSRRQVIICLLLYRRIKKNRAKKQKRWWVHPIHADRNKFGAFFTLYPQLITDPEKFFNFLRMDRTCFETLLKLIGAKYFFLNSKLTIVFYMQNRQTFHTGANLGYSTTGINIEISGERRFLPQPQLRLSNCSANNFRNCPGSLQSNC